MLAFIFFLAFIVFGVMWIISLFKKNGKAIRNIIISVVSFILFIVFIPTGSDGGNADPENKNVSSSDGSEQVESEEVSASDKKEDAEPEEKEKNKDEFGVGEKAELKNNVVEVTKVEKSNGNDFDKPKDGKEYIIVHVSIENSGDKEISYNPFDFKMKNSNGQIEEKSFTTIDSDTSLSSGKLAPGGNVSGTITFEQVIDDPELQLIFEASFWSDKKIVFNL